MKRIEKKCRAGFLLLSMLFYVTGCNNNVMQENALNEDGKVAITVHIGTEAWNVAQTNTPTKSIASKATIPFKAGCITAILEPASDAQTRATPLPTGTKFRVILYKENDVSATGYISHKDCKIGSTAPVFELYPGSTYTFVCYTYGTSADLPAFNKDVTAVSTTTATQNLMYVKQNHTIGDNYHALTLNLVHVFSKITAIADATADDYKIKACNATFATSYEATMSLTDGSLTKGSSITPNVAWLSLDATKITSQPLYVYTNDNSVNLNFNSITIDDHTLNNVKITFNQILEVNKTYTLKVFFSQKGVGGTKLSNLSVYWAPGNLIGTPNGDGTFSYSFASTREYYSGDVNGGDYWCWSTASPMVHIKDTTTTAYVDACQLVPPAGTWRLPTKEEFMILGNQTNSVWTTRENSINGRYFGTDVVPTSGTVDNFLFLPAAGYIFSEGESSSFILDCNSSGSYWASDNGEATWCQFYPAGFGGYVSVDYMKQFGVNLYNQGASIRCVTDYKTTDSSIKIGDWIQDDTEWNGGTQTYIKN